MHGPPESPRHGPQPPWTVTHPVMEMEWRTLTFLHWRYPVAAVQPLLPAGLEVEPYDGSAWVGLVPFRMVVRPPVGPNVPWLSRFPETNVRTYVRGPGGRVGVWFFSLEAARLPAVLTARTTYRLPYFWARMSVDRAGGVVAYRSTRRWPGPRGATSRVRVRPLGPIPLAEVSEFEHYLTARFALFSVVAGRVTWAQAEHPPWPLQRAEVLALDETLVTAVGLPPPAGAPLVHFSEGVTVQVGAPHVLR